MAEIGNFSTISQRFMEAVPNSTLFNLYHPEGNRSNRYINCGFPPKNSLHLIRPATDSQLPWPGVFIGLTISSIWYWCSDQVEII